VEGGRSNAHRQLRHDQAAPVRRGGLRLAARRLGAQVLRAAARRFNQIAWPALAVLVATGIGNIAAERDKITGSYRTTLVAKLAAVPVPGITAFLRARSRSAPQGLRFSAP
jgi:putative copper export protein